MTKALGKKENKLQEIKRAATAASKEKRLKLEKESESGFELIAKIEHQRTVPLEFPIDDLSEMEAMVAEEKYRPFMLLKAADHILTKHLDASPPKKYSYKEWTWLLKLLGEDETDESGHRRVGQVLPEGAEVVSPMRENNRQVWSWLGQESPLMSLEEGGSINTFVIRCCFALANLLQQIPSRNGSSSVLWEC